MKHLSEEFSSTDRYLGLEAFSEGRSFQAWKLFGAHPDIHEGQEGYRFLLWAPNAKQVCVMGDFNSWNQSSHPMTALEGGLWEAFLPNLTKFTTYKYAVHCHDGRVIAKADPYAFHSETRPATGSKLYPIEDDYQWSDHNWKEHVAKRDPYHSPMNIYECHLGSWRRGGDGEFLTYQGIADYLVPYVKEMGYTHVELLPVMEHPLDDSWGYQVTGYFSATSRFGTPDGLKYLIDQLHRSGIGVILDWVPAHFPRDEFGLFQFDGTATYEYDSPLKGEHPQWGTNCFDLGRNEVKSFLFSSAMFWLEEYHADGLRVDAVSSMLYLNFGREDSPWQANVHGGQENLEAISFLQELNTNIFQKFPHVLMVAEEATDWQKVTHAVADGGLGFNFKWNMGWMNDICHYIKQDPLARQHHHKDLTFPLMYAFNENYILPMSHDEVVHKKSSFLGKMQGDTFQKLSASRGFQLYILTHVGKKLNFMGAEIGQWGEWAFTHSLDWHLLEYEQHKQLNHFHKTANQLYLSQPALWEKDTSWDGFLWLCADDAQGNTLAYARWDNQGNPLVIVCNFSPVHRNSYRLPLPLSGQYHELCNSDWGEFGGSDQRNHGTLYSEPVSCYGQEQSMAINLPPNATVVFRFLGQHSEESLKLLSQSELETELAKNTATAKAEPPKPNTPPLQQHSMAMSNQSGSVPVSLSNPKGTSTTASSKLGASLVIGDISPNEEPVPSLEILSPKKKGGRPKKSAKAEPQSNITAIPIVEESTPKKKGGRPKKVVKSAETEAPEEKLTESTIIEETAPKKKGGRPKKVVKSAETEAPEEKLPESTIIEESAPKKKGGRPKKVVKSAETEAPEEKLTESTIIEETAPKKKGGRPKKVVKPAETEAPEETVPEEPSASEPTEAKRPRGRRKVLDLDSVKRRSRRNKDK